MESWLCPCGSEISAVDHTRDERPSCRWCGSLMFLPHEADSLGGEQWKQLQYDRQEHRERLQRECRVLADDAHRDPLEVAANLYARLDGLERRIVDPIAALDEAIPRMTLDELEVLNQRLEAIGVRMVERAADLRDTLKES